MRPRNLVLTALGALSACLWLAGATATAQRASREQRAIVSVVDKNNKPISGLTASDFTVRENGVAREVLRIEEAAAPQQIMLLVDTSGSMRDVVTDLRAGVKAFAAGIFDRNPESEVGLMEFGLRPVLIVDRASAPNLIDRAADRLNAHADGGAYMLDAIVDATKVLKKRDGPRPVIVAFVSSQSPEFSNRNYQEIENALKDARASLWVLLLEPPGSGQLSDEGRQREMVMGDVTLRSGGVRDVVLNRMGVESRFKQMADLLANQTAVVYGRPESLIPPSTMEVSVKRSGARVLASRWTGQ